MVGAILLDKFSTLIGQPSTYWQHPETANELNPYWHHSLSRGWQIYCLDSLISIVSQFLIVSIIPRRIALFTIFYIILGHYFGASWWLCYHWNFGTEGISIYSVIFSVILVVLVFPKLSKATNALLPHEPDTTIGAFKTILLVICVALVLADDSSRIWAGLDYAGDRAFVRQFKVEALHTNDTSTIGVFYANTERPLWTESALGHGKMESYYFRGKDVFDITLSSNRPPKYSVYFRGLGKSETWWLDRSGNGSFTERIFYDTNGDFAKHEIWYKESWQTVDRRNGKNGILMNGQWHQLALDTNGWTIETVTNRQVLK
jgi:hypothetical protein